MAVGFWSLEIMKGDKKMSVKKVFLLGLLLLVTGCEDSTLSKMISMVNSNRKCIDVTLEQGSTDLGRFTFCRKEDFESTCRKGE